MNKSDIDRRIGELFIQRSQLESSNPTPQPTPTPIQPPTGKMPVRILFFGLSHSYKPPLDININGIWYDFSVAMDVKFRINSAVGTLIHVEAPIRTIEIARSSIYSPNLNNGGFGNCNIKYGAVPENDSMLDVNDSFWSRWVHGKADHTGRHGSLSRGNVIDEKFYNMNVPLSFNDSAKFAIYVSGYGENR